MKGMIDIHCHVLPRIDDGARNMEQTKKMLQMAEAEGIRSIIVTPHYHEGVSTNSIEDLEESMKSVQQEIDEMNSSIKLYLGTEIYYSHDSIQLLNDKIIPTLAGSRYVLVEFSPMAEYRYIMNGLQEFLFNGYNPILAHTERYENIVKKIETVEDLLEMGAYIQINAMSITGETGKAYEKISKKLLKKGLVHFIATDSHSDRTRSPRLERCVHYLTKKYGEDYARELLIDNPNKIIDNIDL